MGGSNSGRRDRVEPPARRMRGTGSTRRADSPRCRAGGVLRAPVGGQCDRWLLASARVALQTWRSRGRRHVDQPDRPTVFQESIGEDRSRVPAYGAIVAAVLVVAVGFLANLIGDEAGETAALPTASAPVAAATPRRTFSPTPASPVRRQVRGGAAGRAVRRDGIRPPHQRPRVWAAPPGVARAGGDRSIALRPGNPAARRAAGRAAGTASRGRRPRLRRVSRGRA